MPGDRGSRAAGSRFVDLPAGDERQPQRAVDHGGRKGGRPKALTPEKLVGGVEISYDFMEIYQDGAKEYARNTQTPDRTLAKTTAPVQQQQTFVAVQEIKKEPKSSLKVL